MEAYRPKIVKFVSLNMPKLPQYELVNRDGSTIYVYDAKLIRLLSEALRVQYEVLTPPDISVGTREQDGNWSGMLGMVIRSEVDLAMCGITVTNERYRAVNFTFPHVLSRITFMTDKPQPVSKNLAIFHPFSYEVWTTLFLLFAAVALLFYVLLDRRRSLQSVLLITVGSLLQQSLDFGRGSATARAQITLSLAWILGVMVITNSYKAVLLSFLSFPTLDGIRDISDLSDASVERPSFKCFTFRGSYLVDYFLESNDRTWRRVGECLSRTVVVSEHILEAFAQTVSEKAFVGSSVPMAAYANNYFISEDSFFIMLASIPFSRDFCCPDRLNAVVHRIVASGLVDKIMDEEDFMSQLLRKSLESDAPESVMKINLDDISGAFYILMSGWLLSLILFFAEILIAKGYP